MIKQLSGLLFSAAAAVLAVVPSEAPAGGDAPIVPAPVYEFEPTRVSMPQVELMLKDPDVTFYDVNTMEIWGDGFLPGAVFFSVSDWQELLPQDKDAVLVFYCQNRLCTSSEMAAREVMKLGYTQVYQMPDGIFGWRLSGRPVEKP